MAIPAILPPQSAPPIDDESVLFNRTWWLFFRALADASNGTQAHGSNGVALNGEPVIY